MPAIHSKQSWKRPVPPPTVLFVLIKMLKISAVAQFLLHSTSVLQYNNMNVAGVYPSVFFVSKNVVPFVNRKENY